MNAVHDQSFILPETRTLKPELSNKDQDKDQDKAWDGDLPERDVTEGVG